MNSNITTVHTFAERKIAEYATTQNPSDELTMSARLAAAWWALNYMDKGTPFCSVVSKLVNDAAKQGEVISWAWLQ